MAGSPVFITYRLNQAATAGVTINILSGSNVVATINSMGTNMGLNTNVWTPSLSGAYSVSVTAGAVGFPIWTQISVDTNAGMPAYYPLGIAVDKKTNSPYYGRVVMGCAATGDAGTTNIPLAAEQIGLYKMNADGSQADEGWYGNAGYTNDDAGDGQVAGQFANSGGYDPMKIRIGEDDRIYWVDDSDLGAIIACDMQATTNQLVINEGPLSEGLPSIYSYSQCPDYGDLGIGIQVFDILGTATTNATLFLPCNDSPGWGMWMFHLTNGACNTNDIYGTQVIEVTNSDILSVTSGGCSVDTNLDVFVSQSLDTESAVFQTLEFSNWNHGVLPPVDSTGSTAFTYALGASAGQVSWGDLPAGPADYSFESIQDTVINNRTNPTMVALPMGPRTANGNGGIKVVNATNGAIITVTNSSGVVIQSLTNIDYPQSYTCAAWDNVGNLYGASTTRNVWRVWSPPGAPTKPPRLP